MSTIPGTRRPRWLVPRSEHNQILHQRCTPHRRYRPVALDLLISNPEVRRLVAWPLTSDLRPAISNPDDPVCAKYLFLGMSRAKRAPGSGDGDSSVYAVAALASPNPDGTVRSPTPSTTPSILLPTPLSRLSPAPIHSKELAYSQRCDLHVRHALHLDVSSPETPMDSPSPCDSDRLWKQSGRTFHIAPMSELSTPSILCYLHGSVRTPQSLRTAQGRHHHAVHKI
ncbi:hypothetical protein QBC39DRAFT_334206 [Podospora conica]|nr:hypothetical protein QBC39DRAFT_334206 [Schizothecium conicum]